MIVLGEQEKRDELEDLLYYLASDQNVLQDKKNRADCFRRLESIYYKTDEDNFRHFYSDLFSCLTVIDGNPNIGNIDILAENMKIVKDGYKPNVNYDINGNPIDISKEIIKLYDHINLDVGRLNYTHRITQDTEAELAKARLLIEELKKQVEESKKQTDRYFTDFGMKANTLSEEIQTSQKKMQNEYITILGIFAAIVLAFTGGMSFTSSVLENLHKSSIYRIIFVSLIIGCILFNLIWLLIDFIRNVNEKTIRKVWMFWFFNILFIGLMVLTGFAYKYDWMSREENINQKINTSEENESNVSNERLETETQETSRIPAEN